MPTHAERRRLPYSQEQMFTLVADVERYPEFLPWCLACRISRRVSPTIFLADLVIGFKVVREQFSSRVELSNPHRIDVTYEDGPFRYLTNHWCFEADGENACVIDFYIDFEFRSRTLQALIGKLFNEAVQRMVNAFERRAHALHDQQQRKAVKPASPNVAYNRPAR